jgi:hypothetical protein
MKSEHELAIRLAERYLDDLRDQRRYSRPYCTESKHIRDLLEVIKELQK